MSQRALRPLVDSVAGRAVAAYAFASVNSVACAEGRAVPWLQKKTCAAAKHGLKCATFGGAVSE